MHMLQIRPRRRARHIEASWTKRGSWPTAFARSRMACRGESVHDDDGINIGQRIPIRCAYRAGVHTSISRSVEQVQGFYNSASRLIRLSGGVSSAYLGYAIANNRQ